nr:hypothetical protein [Pseudomonas sp. BIGb0427]
MSRTRPGSAVSAAPGRGAAGPRQGRQHDGSDRADFVAQVQRARSYGEITDAVQAALLLLANGAAPRLDGKAVVCRQISVLGSVLDGALLIGPDPAASNVTERCVAWIAGAPLYPDQGVFLDQRLCPRPGYQPAN